MRTVVEWFGKLSFDAQRGALTQLQERHDQARSTKRADLEKQLAELGFGAPKKRGRPKGVRNVNGPARVGGRKKMVVKAKYRDPKTNETWSGRGRMASWLKSKVDAGEKAEKYLV
jgi:DNA-binding protein H-NS